MTDADRDQVRAVTEADKQIARDWADRIDYPSVIPLIGELAELVAAGRAKERDDVIADLRSRAKELRDVFHVHKEAEMLDILAGTYAAILADRLSGRPVPLPSPEPKGLAASGLTWTGTPPTERGYFWWRASPTDPAVPVRYRGPSTGVVQAFDTYGHGVLKIILRQHPACQWCPIPTPSERPSAELPADVREPHETPTEPGWYECWAVDDRWEGEMRYRAWGNYYWWTPLPDGWVSSRNGIYYWRGPVADVSGPAPDGTNPRSGARTP